MIGSRVPARLGVEDFKKWRMGLGEVGHGVDGINFDREGRGGGEQGRQGSRVERSKERTSLSIKMVKIDVVA